MRRLKKFLDAYLHRFKLGSLRLKRKIVTEKKEQKNWIFRERKW